METKYEQTNRVCLDWPVVFSPVLPLDIGEYRLIGLNHSGFQMPALPNPALSGVLSQG